MGGGVLRLSKNYSQQLKRDKPSPWRGRWHLRKQMTDEGTARSAANVVILPFCRLRGPSSVGFAASFSPREKPYPAQAFCCNTSIKRTFFNTLKRAAACCPLFYTVTYSAVSSTTSSSTTSSCSVRAREITLAPSETVMRRTPWVARP